MCNLSFDVVKVLRTPPLCLPTLMSPFLVCDLSFDIIWELTKKKLFLTFTKKIVCNNLLQVCNLIPFSFMFQFIELMAFKHLWELSLTSSIANKFKNVVSPCLFFPLYCLQLVCVFHEHGVLIPWNVWISLLGKLQAQI